MRLKKAMKRIVALGIGATMMGATILGASAAADLADYPSPFISGGKFDGKFVVGNNAAPEDVIGSVDIATSLQFASTTSGASGSGAVTTFTGDAWKVGTSSKKLEMSELLDSDNQPRFENINNITTFIDGSDLNALGDGSVSSDKGTASYTQYLHWENTIKSATSGSEYVIFTESDEDEIGDFFYIANTEQIARYEMEFKTSFQSDVEDSAGSSSTSGKYLTDYEGEVLNIIGMDYEIVKARRINTDGADVGLTLMGGALKTTMSEGETKTFKVDGKDYEITATSITDTGTIEVKFEVNGEITKSITEGNSDTLVDGTELGVTDLMPNEAGDPTGDLVEFYLGASKVYLKDTDITDVASSTKLEIGNEKIDDAEVIIEGTDDNSTFSIDSIQINITAGDDYYIPAGGILSSLMDEPQALMNWDIEYKGLGDVATEEIRIRTSGSDQYELEFVDGNEYTTSVPIAYTASGSGLVFGDNDDSLVITENQSILRNDYLIVTDESQESGERNTFALRYKGADKSTDDNPVVKFQNLGDGTTIEKSHKTDSATNHRKATLKIGGANFNVYNASNDASDNFNVWVDLDASGSDVPQTTDAGVTGWTSSETVKINTNYGAEIQLSNLTDSVNNQVGVNIRTVDTDDYETLKPMDIKLNITASSGEVRVAEVGNYSLKSPEDDRYTETGYTSLGTKITRTKPTDSPQTVTIEYPEQQRTPEVFVTSGMVSYTSSGGAVETTTIQRIEVGAAVLASEVTNPSADNLILVGGPCANAVAREIMGATLDTCAEGFMDGKAKIKLYEQSTGKVALLVAGYSAADTRRAARVLANYADHGLSGAEVEVSGTSLSDVSVSKVA